MKEPLLSIIIPSCQRAALLEEALASLYPLPSFPVEIFVSENSDSEASAAVVQKFPEVNFRQRGATLPMAKHWNLCLSEARGKYVKLLCDDDWVLPGALAREVKCLEENPLLVAVASAREEVSFDRQQKGQVIGSDAFEILGKHQAYRRMIREENVLGPPSCVTFVRKHFRAFPEEYSYAADWAAWILLLEGGPVARLPEVGCGFRLHPGNLTQKSVREGLDISEGFALRKELWLRMGTPPLLTLEIVALYFYRLARRFARSIVRGENPLTVWTIFTAEKKESLEKSYPPARG
jgi:glycosyltransferase involved in cell wall biosynthesis